MEYTIYVPTVGSRAEGMLAPGSAVVGSAHPDQDGLISVHYEGNTNGAGNLETYHARLVSAAGRRVVNYPTVARGNLPAQELRAVGTFDARRYVVSSLGDPDSLRAWSGEGPEQVVGARMPTGRCSWAQAAEISNKTHSRPVGPQKPQIDQGQLWFRTQAGQLLRFTMGAEQAADVFDDNDPKLPALLAAVGVPADTIERILDTPPAAGPHL